MLNFAGMEKNDTYQMLLKQVESLLEGVNNPVGQLANAAAIVHETMGFWWTGFYLVKDDKLQLGPFQGPIACYEIKRGRGVCGTAWKQRKTIVVPDVEEFPGHIACSSESKSEIVVPVFNEKGDVTAVLDIDDNQYATFDNTDAAWLEWLAALV